MKRLSVLLTVGVFMCLLTLHTNSFAQTEKGIKTLVIDAGHGGHDPGTIGATKKYEKDIALAVALKLGAYVEELLPDVEVIYTRDSDEFIELHERANIANKNNADFFISIHCNAAASSSAYGAESWVLGLHKTEANLDVAKKENAVIELEDNADEHYAFDPNSFEGHIIMSMKQNTYLDQSIQFADLVQDQFEFRVKRNNRGVKQAGFMVLYKTTMPSILIELGFISNPEEEAFLNSVEGQDYMASAIFRAFRDYKELVDAGVIKKSEDVVVEEIPTPNEEVIVANTNNTAAKDGLVFRVQVYASTNKAEPGSKVYQQYNGIPIIIEDNGYGVFRHMAGSYATFPEAQKALNEAVVIGYKDAFVVAYQNGKRIAVDEALSIKE